MTREANEGLPHVQGDHFLARPPIVLTASDRDKLLAFLRIALTKMDPRVARFLREELERADIVSGAISPSIIVSIGSIVRFIDHKAMTIREATLVSPREANGIDLISVTGALGSALIGLGPGQTIKWYDDQTERQSTVLETSKSR